MISGIEKMILEGIYSLVGASGFLDGVFVFCARFLVYISTLVFLSKLLVHREPYERLTKIFYTTLALVLSAGILQGVLGYIVSRVSPGSVLGVRTLLEFTGVFPSLATTWAVTIASIASVALTKRLGTWLMIIAAFIAFSQLYTGLSWPIDILVSFVIGIAGALIAKRIIPPTQS